MPRKIIGPLTCLLIELTSGTLAVRNGPSLADQRRKESLPCRAAAHFHAPHSHAREGWSGAPCRFIINRRRLSICASPAGSECGRTTRACHSHCLRACPCRECQVVDHIVGFDELGGTDSFDTEVLEWRLSTKGLVHYDGDLEGVGEPRDALLHACQLLSRWSSIGRECVSRGSGFLARLSRAVLVVRALYFVTARRARAWARK